MNKILFLSFVLFLVYFPSAGQTANENIIYIIDSIPVVGDSEEDYEIAQTDIADFTVIKNKDTLKLSGFKKFEEAIYLFTKEYRNRPENIKQIPSSKQMQRKEGVWLLHGSPYSGQFIDYYYNGKIQSEGTILYGKPNGLHRLYYLNGKLLVEKNYKEGLENGLEKEYYEDGSLKQKGEFVNGKEEGIWDMYFPNGQLKQRSSFKDGNMEGETTVYYSTGKIFAVEVTQKGKTIPDKRLEKINKIMQNGHESSKEGDYKTAIKNYSKAIKLDSTYAKAYFSRGTVKLNDFKFDEAIADFDKALMYEPFMNTALSNRAFARIRKYQFEDSRTLTRNSDVTVLASKDKVTIPSGEQEKICSDLHKAVFLGKRSKMIKEALLNYCQ